MLTRARACVCVWKQTPVLARSNKIRLFGSLSQGGPSGQRPGHGASHQLGCAGTHLRSCVVYQVLHSQACTGLHRSHCVCPADGIVGQLMAANHRWECFNPPETCRCADEPQAGSRAAPGEHRPHLLMLTSKKKTTNGWHQK